MKLLLQRCVETFGACLVVIKNYTIYTVPFLSQRLTIAQPVKQLHSSVIDACDLSLGYLWFNVNLVEIFYW